MDSEGMHLMKISKKMRLPISFFMALLLSHIPALAAAKVQRINPQANLMLPTASVLEELGRTQNVERVREFLQDSEVRAELIKRGVSPEEAKKRIASLNDSELRQLSMQVKEARFGGDILVTILVIVLIIYFLTRL